MFPPIAAIFSTAATMPRIFNIRRRITSSSFVDEVKGIPPERTKSLPPAGTISQRSRE
jgi:hypothetical protein